MASMCLPNTYKTVTMKYTPKLLFATQTNKPLIKNKTKQTNTHKKTFRSRIVFGKSNTLVQNVGRLAFAKKSRGCTGCQHWDYSSIGYNGFLITPFETGFWIPTLGKNMILYEHAAINPNSLFRREIVASYFFNLNFGLSANSSITCTESVWYHLQEH